jgi:hypothetical protein
MSIIAVTNENIDFIKTTSSACTCFGATRHKHRGVWHRPLVRRPLLSGPPIVTTSFPASFRFIGPTGAETEAFMELRLSYLNKIRYLGISKIVYKSRAIVARRAHFPLLSPE